jgi:hypothetical protein
MQAAAAGSSAAYVYWLRSAGKYLYFGKNSRILEYLSALFAALLLLPCLRLLAERAKCTIRKITRIISTRSRAKYKRPANSIILCPKPSLFGFSERSACLSFYTI